MAMRVAVSVLLPVCLFGAQPMLARAELAEQLVYKYYKAEHAPGRSLRDSLNLATPIRHDGEVFHGHTNWHVQWRFRWQQDERGRCRLVQNRTELTADITLPELSKADEPTRRAFDAYLPPLKAHELGHFQIAQSVARKIDDGILALPAMNSCAQLERAANQLGRDLIEQGNLADKQYDQTTGHGRTQGAWLPR